MSDAPQRASISWQGDSGQTFNLTIDCSRRIQHDMNNTVTDHPVETGSNVSDHIRPDPDTVTIEGVISNAPIFLPSDHAGGATEVLRKITASWSGRSNKSTVHGAQNTIGDILPLPHLLTGIPIGGGDTAAIGRTTPGGSLAANVKAWSQDFDRAGECFEELRSLRDLGVLCRVITKRREYDNMAIVSLSVTDEARTGDALVFSIGFKAVLFGVTKNEPVPALPRKKVSKGAVTPEPGPAVEPDEDSSLLHRMVH